MGEGQVGRYAKFLGDLKNFEGEEGASLINVSLVGQVKIQGNKMFHRSSYDIETKKTWCPLGHLVIPYPSGIYLHRSPWLPNSTTNNPKASSPPLGD